MAKMLGVNGTLTALDLSFIYLEDEGVSTVCEAIQNNKETKLASLNFTDNFIGPVGANAVAAMVAVTGALTKLSLAKNELGEEGTKFLCDALVGNNTLKELDLSGDISNSGFNIGGTAGAKHVANMLLVNGGLTKLSLAWNKLEEEGTKAICEALKQNKTLKELDLSGNKNLGGEAGTKHVADMLGVNGALSRVDIRSYNFASDSAAQLSAAVLGNLKIEMFNEIPIKEMRADSFTELDLMGKRFGVEGGMVVAGLIPVMGALKKME